MTDLDDDGNERTRIVHDHRRSRASSRRSSPKASRSSYVNKTLDKKALSHLIDVCYRKHRNKATVLLADRLRSLGFEYATKAGVSDLHGSHGHPGRRRRSSSTRRRPRSSASSISTRKV